MRRRTSLLAATLAAAFATACERAPTSPAALEKPSAAAPRRSFVEGSAIPGRYIVVFMDDVPDVRGTAMRLAARNGGHVDWIYSEAIKGMSVSLPAAAVEAIESDPQVAYVEPDFVVSGETAQTGATWGLDRIDQRLLPLDGSYSYSSGASGVTAYVFDSGINYSHADFGGRAVLGIDAVTSGGSGADCNGHGTHVAGTIGGATYGVAKMAKLVSVRVLACDLTGTSSSILAGLDYVTGQTARPAVANMSLNGPNSLAFNQAVENSVASGVTYVVSAGNASANACNYSPGSSTQVINVGATDRTDVFASFSNYGSCVTLNAPGVSITSDWYGSTTATATISGTSMSAPHVAGVAALYLAAYPTAKPADVKSALRGNATANVITSLPSGTPNLLAYSIGGAAPAPPPAPVVSASFTYTCARLACSFDASASANAVSYSWTFGDGSSGTGVTTTHTYAGKSNNKVYLTTRAADGSSATASRVINCNNVRCN